MRSLNPAEVNSVSGGNLDCEVSLKTNSTGVSCKGTATAFIGAAVAVYKAMEAVPFTAPWVLSKI